MTSSSSDVSVSDGASQPVAIDYLFGPFRLDSFKRQLARQGEPVALPPRALEVLVTLVEHAPNLVEKEDLIKTVWPDVFVSDDSLTQAISAVRKALDDHTAQPAYVLTVPRRGYRFVAEVEAWPHQVSVGPRIPEPERPTTAESSARPLPTGPSHSLTFRWTYAVVAGLAAVLGILLIARTADVAPRGMSTGMPIRFEQSAPPGTRLASSGVLSPDGRHLTFTAQDVESGRIGLWLRRLDQRVAEPLPGTEGAHRPFWAPNSRSIAFFADGRLKKVGIEGGPPQTLASVGYRPSGGSWSSQGFIIYADRASHLFGIPDSGGTPRSVTTLNRARGDRGHQAPHFLPDGRHFLFYVNASEADSGTYIGSLDSADHIRLLGADARNAVFSPPGFLLYRRDAALVAQRFDPDALRVSGAPVFFLSGEDGQAGPGIGPVSASANGVLTIGGERPPTELVWFDRRGERLGAVAANDVLHNPAVSPDARFLVANGASGIWLIDLERGAPTRLVPNGNLPAFSADGSHILFTSRVSPHAALMARSIDSDKEVLMVRSSEMKLAGNQSPDGRYLVYASSNPQTRLDLWTALTDGTSAPEPFLITPGNEMQPQISPDGRWLAYTSDESGTWEVYVQSFPNGGGKRAVSVGGGSQPQWRRDGRELYFLSPDGTLMSVQVQPSTVTWEGSVPARLFRMPVVGDRITMRNQYAAAPDGTRFIVDSGRDPSPIEIVVNWTALVNP